MKKGNIHFIYYSICYKYLFDKPERKIESLEKILFLMQYESLIKDKKPIIKEKIYISNGEIRIRYLSDLLRVSPVLPIGLEGFYSQKRLKAIRVQVNKYIRLDCNSLNERVNNIIKKQELDSKYFVFEKYINNKMRKEARLTVKEYIGWLSVKGGKYIGWNFRKTVGFCIITPWLLGTVFSLLIYIETSENFYFETLLWFFTLTVVSSLMYLIWTYRWSKPTKYEIENGYLEE